MGRDWISVPIGRGVRVGHSWTTGFGYRQGYHGDGSIAGMMLVGTILGWILGFVILFFLLVLFTIVLFLRGIYNMAKGQFAVGLFWIILSLAMAYGELAVSHYWIAPELSSMSQDNGK